MSCEKPCEGCPKASKLPRGVISSGVTIPGGVELRHDGTIAIEGIITGSGIYGKVSNYRSEVRHINDDPELEEAVENCPGPQKERVGILGHLGIKRTVCPALPESRVEELKRGIFADVYRKRQQIDQIRRIYGD